MFLKMLVVWCAVAVVLAQADLVPYTLGGTTIMVDSNVLGYNSPLLSSLIQGMPHRSEPTARPNVQHSLQHQNHHTLSATSDPESASTDFKKDPEGHLDITVYPDENSQNPHASDDVGGLPKPITIEEAAGIYLGDERIPFTNDFRKPTYYSVPTPNVADVSEKIHHIVSALNQETTGAKLNDRAPVPLLPPISDAVGFGNDAQYNRYPVQLEELPQETTFGSFANEGDSANKVVPKDTENEEVTTTNSEVFGTFNDGELSEIVTTLGSTSTETYLHETILEGNIIRYDPDTDSAPVFQMSDDHDFSEVGQTTEIPLEEDSTSVPLEEVLLQKEEELALLHQEESQNIQEELEDQMALEEAMADVLGSLFSGDEETDDDLGTESSATTPEHDSENEASTVTIQEVTETQAPVLFDPLISETIIHDLNKQVQSSGLDTEPVRTNVKVDQQLDETPAEKQDDNIALQIQSSVQDLSSDIEQTPIGTEQISAKQEEKKEGTRPLIADAAIETDSTYDQTSVNQQEEKQEDQTNVKIIQQIKSSAEDEAEQNIHSQIKQIQSQVQDTNTETGQSVIESNLHSGHNLAEEVMANQEETKDDVVGVLNANDSTDQEIQVPIPDSSMLADFPPARGGPEGAPETDSPTPVRPDVPPPVFLYSPHSLNPITLGQAGGVYINDEEDLNTQFQEHPSGYSTRHDPPGPDTGLLTWYDQDPINIFDPLQAERVTGTPQSSHLSPQYSSPNPTPKPSDNEVNVGRPIPGSVPSLRPAIPTNTIPGSVPSLRPAIPTNTIPGSVPSLRPAIPTNTIPGSVPSLRPAIPTNTIPVVTDDDLVSLNETTGTRIQTGGAVFHSADPETLQKSTCRCGLRFNTKIVGGLSTTIDQFPWMAAITSAADNFTFCGGSLLNDKFVLTAAHCVDGQDPRDIYVRFGETSRDHSKSTNIAVKKFIVHKKYDSYIVYKNDIALIELAKPIAAFTDRIYPVCLTTGKESYSEESATVSGWGRNSFGGDVTQGLMEATVNVLSTKDCKQNSKYQKYEVHNKIVCALGDGIDACQGDSGGPLVVLEKDHYKQLGIVSWGIGCAQKEYPGIYTRVSAYSNWIQANIKDGTGCRVGATSMDGNKGNKKKGNKNKNKNKNKNDGMIGGSRPLFSILNRGSGPSDKKEEDQLSNNSNNKQDQKKNPNVNNPTPKPEAEDTKVENQRPGVNNDKRKGENKDKSPTSSASGGGLKLPNLRRPGSNNNRNNPKRKKNQNRDRPGQGNKAQNNRQDITNDQDKQKKKPDTSSAVVTSNPQPLFSLKPASENSKPPQGQKTATGEKNNNNNNNNNPGGTRNNQKNRPQRNRNKNKTESQNNEGNSDGLNWSNLQEALKGIGQIINKEKAQESQHAIAQHTTQDMNPVTGHIINVDAPL